MGLVPTDGNHVRRIASNPLRPSAKGMVIRGGRSYAVRRVGLGEYLKSLKVRQVLEAEAAGLAAGRVPGLLLASVRSELLQSLEATSYHTDAHWRSGDNLHNMFIDHCGNEVMARILKRLRATTRLFEIDRLKERMRPDSREHLAILDAIGAGDPDGVRQAVRIHTQSLVDFALQAIRRDPLADTDGGSGRQSRPEVPRGRNAPYPGSAATAPWSNTMRPRTIVVTGQPVTSSPS